MAFTRRAKLGALALAGGGLAALAALWSYREPIARDALDRYLAARGVKASYQIKAIETRRQRLEHVRIGSATQPDLIADWVEIDVGPSFTGLSVKAVRAGGVRLRAKATPEKISFGVLDRLLPPPSGAPFRLPDVDLSVEDARARIESPWGQMGLRLDGQGNLRAGFEGKIAGVAPRLSVNGCTSDRLTIYGDVSVVGGRPSFAGPVRSAGLSCNGVAAEASDALLEASISEDLTNWRGNARVQLARTKLAATMLRGTSADLQFEGSARKTDSRFKIEINALHAGEVAARRTLLEGKATFGQRGVLVDGTLRSERFSSAGLGRMATRAAAAGSAPVVGPLAGQFAKAVRALGEGLSGKARFAVSMVDGQRSFSLGDIAMTSISGARLFLPGREAFTLDEAGPSLSGTARFGGGGLPGGRAEFAGKNGLVTLAPYRAGRSVFRLSPTRLLLRPAGLDISTRASLDGPLGGGWVRGLSLPIRLRAGQGLAMGCFPLGYDAIRFGETRLSKGRITTCTSADSIRLVHPLLTGSAGAYPLRVAASQAHYRFSDGSFFLIGARLRQGDPASPTDVALDRLAGQVVRGDVKGRLDGAGGQLGGVPLRLSEGSGKWRYADGKLRFLGKARVADTTSAPRFFPVLAQDVQMTLRGGELKGTAELRAPRTGALLSQLSLAHNLSTGTGWARLRVDDLRFGPALQPEAITPITLGVVANVQGALSGEGRINWTANGVTSSGAFRTSGLDFAGAFGPVTGFAGTIEFSDLLGLVTGAHQQLKVASINPGVLVTDGVIQYRLLPGYRVQVEGGRWPFAGGVLVLEPSLLDMSETAERRLTFRVEGLDAARFISTMGFENIAATGIYDGVLPMIFDASGGRIEGGKLIARGGGTLSYVGQVSNENIGTMGRVAFDALKSMRYNRLEIELNGAIDGDVITKISFAGVNLAPVAGARAKLPIKLLGTSNLPFVFNVTISAKFRALFEMARTIGDPSGRISDWISANEPQKPVQPAESEPKR